MISWAILYSSRVCILSAIYSQHIDEVMRAFYAAAPPVEETVPGERQETSMEQETVQVPVSGSSAPEPEEDEEDEETGEDIERRRGSKRRRES